MNAKGVAAYRILVPVLLGSVAVAAVIYAGDRFWDRQEAMSRPVTYGLQFFELIAAALLMGAANGLGLKRGQGYARLAMIGALVLGGGMAIVQVSGQLAGGLTFAGLEESLREIANFAVGGLFGGLVAGIVAQTMQQDDMMDVAHPLGPGFEPVPVPVNEDVQLRR